MTQDLIKSWLKTYLNPGWVLSQNQGINKSTSQHRQKSTKSQKYSSKIYPSDVLLKS